MDFGLHLPSAQQGANAADILMVAKGAEALGFDTVWMFDHLFTPSNLESKYPYNPKGDYAMTDADPFFDPVGVYGVVAGATERVKMGTNVMIGAYRHPINLGKTLASIEQFAPERILLGLGAGWMREEFEAVDVPYERRGARFEEYMQALRAVWSGKPNSFEGEFYSWTQGGFLPAPTKPIPIIVGGHGDRALQRAAKYGDGWAAVTAPGQGAGLDGIAGRIEVVKEHLEKEGRDPADFIFTFQHAAWFSEGPNPKLPLTGPPDVIAASLKRLEELGVSMVDFLVFGPGNVIVENGQRLIEEVKPLL
jgi:probable F420-dependent oxidoreductase